MIPRLTLALALLLATCGANPAHAAPAPLLLKNMIGKVVEGGSYSRITLDNCRGCIVRGAIVTPPPATNINDQAVRVINSPGVVLEGLTITGQAATTGVAQTAPGPAGLVIGLWAGEGIHIEKSPGAIIRGNIITRFHQGIAFGKFDGLRIEANTIANLRTSGIVGVPGNNVTITGNGIGASFPWRWGQTPAGDHADKIHLWSAGGNVTGLTITDNLLDDGAGVAILGLFVQPKNGGFDNVTIERNTIRIGQGQAMSLGYVRGSVSFNELVPLATGKATARIDANAGCAGVWRGNTGGLGVVFNRRLTAAQRAAVTVLP